MRTPENTQMGLLLLGATFAHLGFPEAFRIVYITEYVRNMYRICVEYVWNKYGIHME